MSESYNSTNLSADNKFAFLTFETRLTDETQLLINLYRYSGLPLWILGIIGHSTNLLTMFLSSDMQTPSFLYHKTLSLAELAYCLNCVVQEAVNVAAKVENASETYGTAAAAVYSASVSRVVSSVTGYVTLYMTLLIAVDRLFAISFTLKYITMNKRQFAFVAITASFILSVFVNSWASPVEYVYKQVEYAGYQLQLRGEPSFYIDVRRIKNIYNSAIRIAFPIVLVLITLAVVGGFLVQRRKQHRLVRSVAANRRAVRRNQNLFCLLMINCLLAIIQVIPTETRRILELHYPVSECKKAMEWSFPLDIDIRLKLMAIYIYGHVWTKILANLNTFISRSLSFYVNLCFNQSFRTAVMKTVWRPKIRRPKRSRDSTTSLLLTSMSTH